MENMKLYKYHKKKNMRIITLTVKLSTEKEETIIMNRAAAAHFPNGSHYLKFESSDLLPQSEVENLMINVTAIWCMATTAFCMVRKMIC